MNLLSWKADLNQNLVEMLCELAFRRHSLGCSSAKALSIENIKVGNFGTQSSSYGGILITLCLHKLKFSEKSANLIYSATVFTKNFVKPVKNVWKNHSWQKPRFEVRTVNCRTWNEVLRLLNFFETRSTMIKNYFLPSKLNWHRDRKSFDVEIFHQTLRLRHSTNSLILAGKRSHPCTKVIKFDARF